MKQARWLMALLLATGLLAMAAPDAHEYEMPAPGDSTYAIVIVNNFKLLRSIPIDAKEIQTDRLGNLFVISKTNQLYKYSPEGKLLSTLNYKYSGAITLVDPTNPLEIYVFYKELNTVIFLDNNLAYRGELKLDNYGIAQASAMARSFDNGIWTFDITDQQLKKMDKNGENMQLSGNVRQYVNSKSFSPIYIFDNNDQVFVNDSANGIFVFDVFAHYLRTIPIRGCSDIKVIDDNLYYYSYNRNNIGKYSFSRFSTLTYALPDTVGVRDLSIEKNRLYLLKQDTINIYGF